MSTLAKQSCWNHEDFSSPASHAYSLCDYYHYLFFPSLCIATLVNPIQQKLSPISGLYGVPVGGIENRVKKMTEQSPASPPYRISRHISEPGSDAGKGVDGWDMLCWSCVVTVM